jgi:hypothetical protein
MGRGPAQNSRRWRYLPRNLRFNHHNESDSMMLAAKHLAERTILAICLLSRYPLSARLQKGNSPAAALVRLHQNVSREAVSFTSDLSPPS